MPVMLSVASSTRRVRGVWGHGVAMKHLTLTFFFKLDPRDWSIDGFGGTAEYDDEDFYAAMLTVGPIGAGVSWFAPRAMPCG